MSTHAHLSQSLLLLTSTLSLPTPETTFQILTFFHPYANQFLSHCRDLQSLYDPDYTQIKLQFSVLPNWSEEIDQTAHAMWFIWRVCEFITTNRAGGTEMVREMVRDEYFLREAHKILCVLQSVWIGNGSWVDDEDGRLREGLWALLGVM
ncbi:hypothetical protein QBC38DRAFT_44891 [Podospora fimiseda]|uniref:Transcription factor domain-containing protein n=1 Tax=Podospora fimiseda TaxID=252190 RepID=A0AAN7BHQ0_9PEZI|nr:hypothetical protein QBC38DRAFT_44891 [Podospora fimiseda]